ncbi:hypothetical protein JCM17823_07920 [Halorubrum gandharaense]
MKPDETEDAPVEDDDPPGFASFGPRRSDRPADRSAERHRRTAAARHGDGDALRWRWLAYLAVGAAVFAVTGMWSAGTLVEHAGSAPADVWLLPALHGAVAELAISVRLGAVFAAGVAALVGGWVALSVGLRTRGGR